MDEEIEKLDKDLQFLKESYDSEVISEEEYLSGKERIEKHMKEFEEKEQSAKKEPEKNEVSEDKPKIEKVKEEKIEEESKVEEKPKTEKIIKPEKEIDEREIKVEEHKEVEKIEPEVKAEEKTEVQKTIPVPDTQEEPKEDRLEQEEEEDVFDSGKGGKWKYLVIGLIAIVILVYLAVPFFEAEEDVQKEEEFTSVLEEPVVEVFIACSSDDECKEKGICENAGTADSECKFVDVVKTELLVVNSEECFNCDTSRVLNLLKGLFPGYDCK